MSAFTVSGVEFVAKGVGPYLSTLGRVDAAQQKLGGSVSGVTERFANAQTGAGRFASALGNVLTVATGIVAAQVFNKIASGIGSAVSAGFEFNNAVEQAGAKINAFTKDGAKTAQILEDVRKEAAATPFEFQAMADATAGLLPAAKQADVGIMDLLRDAEVLAASNPAEGLEGAAFALREAVSGDFTSVIERFNLPRSMINQLKAEGLPALEIVRRAMGEMGYDMDLVSALANTAEGRWSTFKDTLVNVAGTITQPIFDRFSQGLGDVNTWLAANEPMLTNMADLLANQVAEAITTVAAKATELFTAFQSGGFKGLAEVLGVPPETFDMLVGIGTKIGEIITTIASYGGFGLAGILAVDPAARATTLTFLSDLWVWLKTNIPAAINTVSDIWNNKLKPGFTQIGEAISSQLLPALDNLFNAFSEGSGGTQTLADLWTNTLKPALFAVGDFVINSLFPAWVQLEQFLIGGLAVAINLLAGYWKNILFPAISTVATFVKDTVIPALTDLWAWLGPKIGDAVQRMSDLWQNTLKPALFAVGGYIADNIVPLLVSLGNLINAVINKALQAMAGLWQNVVWPALQRVGNFLRDTLSPVFAKIGKSIEEDVSPVLKNLGEVIFPLLQEGLDYVTEAIKTLIGYFDSLTGKVSSFALPPVLQGHSPPPMANFMMDIASATNEAAEAVALMGANIAGADKFIDDLNMGGIARQLGTGGGQWRNFRNILKNEIGASFEQLMTSGMSAAQLIDKIQKVAAKLNFPPSFASEFAMANGLIEHLTSSVTEFQKAMRLENMGRMVQVGGQFASIGSGFADILKGELEGTEGQIQEFRNFLASGNKSFARKIMVDIGSGQMGELEIVHSRITAQLELNQLLKEQARQQRLITQQQKSQEQLSFLQQQIELIKMGKDLGGNVFKGLRFGLDANVEDLLAATNNVVTAMVNQINEDLQISSPSKVMARIGGQVIAGMAQGLENGRSMLDRAIQSTPLLSGALMRPMAQPAYASGNTYNTTYEMPMTVHTASTPQGVIRQYEVKRSMYAS